MELVYFLGCLISNLRKFERILTPSSTIEHICMELVCFPGTLLSNFLTIEKLLFHSLVSKYLCLVFLRSKGIP